MLWLNRLVDEVEGAQVEEHRTAVAVAAEPFKSRALSLLLALMPCMLHLDGVRLAVLTFPVLATLRSARVAPPVIHCSRRRHPGVELWFASVALTSRIIVWLSAPRLHGLPKR